MVTRVLDLVDSCYNAQDGAIIAAHIAKGFETRSQVVLSFAGVYDVPSSFVNSAIVSLFNRYSPDWVKSHLKVIDATSQIADMIRRCMANGERRLADSRNAS